MEPNQENLEEVEHLSEPDTGEESDAEVSMEMVDEPHFYQHLLHKENLRRLDGLEKSQSSMAQTLARIDTNTKDLPKIKEDVDSLKADRNKVLGMSALAITGAPILTWLAARLGVMK